MNQLHSIVSILLLKSDHLYTIKQTSLLHQTLQGINRLDTTDTLHKIPKWNVHKNRTDLATNVLERSAFLFSCVTRKVERKVSPSTAQAFVSCLPVRFGDTSCADWTRDPWRGPGPAWPCSWPGACSRTLPRKCSDTTASGWSDPGHSMVTWNSKITNWDILGD